MGVSSITIEDGCTVCGVCESICPEVFKMGDSTAEIIPGVDLNQFEDKIREAAAGCPVDVIKVS